MSNKMGNGINASLEDIATYKYVAWCFLIVGYTLFTVAGVRQIIGSTVVAEQVLALCMLAILNVIVSFTSLVLLSGARSDRDAHILCRDLTEKNHDLRALLRKKGIAYD